MAIDERADFLPIEVGGEGAASSIPFPEVRPLLLLAGSATSSATMEAAEFVVALAFPLALETLAAGGGEGASTSSSSSSSSSDSTTFLLVDRPLGLDAAGGEAAADDVGDSGS